ncbi:MAG: ABC transporter permease [Chitinophagaceae bacterium]|nr:ABC transporter permease [Chitinophagaceae bacterium]
MLLRLAWRYIIGKKSTQAIQIISWVSVLAMAVGTACLIIVLSVFNGFDGFIKNLYSDYFPTIKITAQKGSVFTPTPALLQAIQKNKKVASFTTCLEEKVLLVYDQNQVVAQLKGVDENYINVNAIHKHVDYGKWDLGYETETPPILLGIGLSNRLGANEESPLPISAYSLNANFSSATLNPEDAYSNMYFMTRSVFVLQEELDNQLAFAPLPLVQQLTQKGNQISSIELKVSSNDVLTSVQHDLKLLLDQQGLQAQNRYEQNPTLYRVLKTERFAVFVILSFMLLIASFNIIGSLSMLVIEKEKDIAILQTMGMLPRSIRNLFLQTGVMLSLFGAGIGMLLAFLVCFLQKQFGFVKLGNSGNFLVDAYPVQMRVFDFILVALIVTAIAFLASWFPAKKASQKGVISNLRRDAQ